MTTRPHREARNEVARLRKSTLIAIRESDEDGVDDNLDVYRELAATFVRRLRSYGATFDREQAATEAGTLLRQAWPEIDWIRDDYITIMEEAFRHPHKGILGAVLYFPTSIAAAALQERDYITFSRLTTDFPRYAYLLATGLADESLRAFVIDRIGRYLAEFAQFHLAARLERADTPTEVSSIAEIAEGLILTLSALLKQTLDQRDLTSFRVYMTHLNKALYDVPDHVPGYHTWERVRAHAPPNTEATDTGQLFEAIQQVLGRVDRIRSAARLGLNAWLTQVHADSAFTFPRFEEWFDACGAFPDLGQLVRTFVFARSYETQDLLKWDWWLLEGKEGVIRIDVDGQLDRVFLLHALRIAAVPTVTADTITALLPTARDFVYLIDRPDAPLRTTLRQIRDAKDGWTPVVRGDIEAGAGILERAFDLTAERQLREWQETVIESPLDPVKVEQFKNDILIGYSEESDVRRLWEQRGRFEVAVDTGGGWGQNTLLPKEIFVSQSNIAVTGYGRDYGAGVARRLGENALNVVLNAIDRTAAPLGPNEAVDVICVAAASLRSEGLRPVIMLVNAWTVYSLLFPDKRFVPGPTQDRRSGSPIGNLDGHPVYQLYHRGDDSFALVGDIAKFGTWRQFTPNPKPQDSEELLGDELLFMLRPVTLALAERLIADNPDFLKSPGSDQPESQNVAKRRLQGRVHFRLFGNADLRIEDPSSVQFIPLVER